MQRNTWTRLPRPATEPLVSSTTPENPCKIEVVGALADISAADWNRVAGPVNPFVQYEFLATLEATGCLGQSSGWYPRHVLVSRDERLVGAMPMYIKTNSHGEFVFDWAFADAYERHGLQYYPKLVVAVPFTPATGPRFLVDSTEPDQAGIIDALVGGALTFAEREEISSVHWLFPDGKQQARLRERGLLERRGYQFHWGNPGFRDFQDFLDSLTHKRRKEIRRERRDVADAGLDMEVLWGRDAQERHWAAFHEFYCAIYDRKWGFPSLTLDFFLTIGERMPDAALLMLAARDGQYIAGTYSLCGTETLFGRNWGCIEQHRGLHFELCYYQHIEIAIARGLGRLEAGAQGEHKVSRGFLPTSTYSAHWIAHPSFRRAVDDFITEEAADVDRYLAAASQHSPFKEGALEQIAAREALTSSADARNRRS
jgi:hypothetical protein